MKKILVVLAFLTFIVLIIHGCSSKGTNITSPKIQPENQNDALPLFILDGPTDKAVVGRGLLGAFKLHASFSDQSAELIPIRSLSNEGDSYLANVISYFTSVPCVDCLTITDAKIDANNNLVLTFRIKHPFPPADTSKPPSGKNRDDLRLFDVKLIVESEGTSEFPKNKAVVNPLVVANADGYTMIEDPIIDKTNDIDTNLFPYKILAEDPTEGNVDPSAITGFSDLANATGHNVLNQGKSYTSDLVLSFQFGGVIDTNLFLFASYGQSAMNLADRFTPQFWLPEFNMKEPWKVQVEVQNNTLNNAAWSTSADVMVDVWDWQHSSIKIDPNLTTLDSIKAASAVSSVEVEIPGVNNPVDKVTSPTSGNGLNTTPLVYKVTVNNDLLAPAGVYNGLVKVTDNRELGLNYGSFGELIDYDPLTTKLTFIKPEEFATYQAFSLSVAEAGGPPCGPITASISYGRASDMFLSPLRESELHFLTGDEWKIKVTPTVPNGTVTNISFDFDDSHFTGQSGTNSTLQMVYTNYDCAHHDPLLINLTMTVKDDCDASADWVFVLPIYIHCGTSCGPITVGTFSYSVNGGDYQPFPASGIIIQNNDELTIKASGFSVQNGTITKYTYDFKDPRILDQSKNTTTVTRVITNPNCTSSGGTPYDLLCDVTVEDDCGLTKDFTKELKITVECPTVCGPIVGGMLEYSLNDGPFGPFGGNFLTIVDGTKLGFRLQNFTSHNANITTYTFSFSDPAYPYQSGPENSVVNTFINPKCSAGFGPPIYVKMHYRIADDCIYSVDYEGDVTIKILCAPCYGAGISFTTAHRVVASGTEFNNLDITKIGGKGMKVADGGGGYLFAGYLGTRISDNKPGIGFARSADNGGSWPLSRFIPTSIMPGGFSIVTVNGITIVAAWFNPDDDTIKIERSVNGGIIFTETQIYDAPKDIKSISLAQDPRDPAKIYLVFIENVVDEGGVNKIQLLRSADSGETFPSGLLTTVYSSSDVYNRPFGAVDIIVSPYNSDVYVAASQNDKNGSDIFIARSNNFGNDFKAGGKILSVFNGVNIDMLDIAATLIDPTGQAIYVAFSQGTETKGAVKLILGNVGTETFRIVNSHINDTTNKRPLAVALAVDKIGEVYVAWQDDRATASKPDIYADISQDGGLTFGEDKIVNDSSPGAAKRTSPEIIPSEADCETIYIYEDNSTVEGGEIYSRVG